MDSQTTGPEILKEDAALEQMTDSEEGDEVSAVLEDLIEMFVAENKRMPTEDEMKQWIRVFRSLNEN
eukprot:CAMPEP_0116069272 /NCGR_PEP_ID=MMETSP0322-20121206/12191_1 /TAXON_ID=163516 /ORGANISM="Leptocylindrus danicus var. apora, Strain B651" /LENGTH=66 /DNA_ID=CAMNT_0003556609 /DNA_START=104 /DNA_END=304 /DNA_ORIENTATION=+